MGFPLYYNPDGSVGKVYKIDEQGATVKVNDASLVPLFDKIHDKIEKEKQDFHNKMMSLGVKAYRYNDAHVDRLHCRVWFHYDNKTEGTYWIGSGIRKGDKIFIGDRYSGGRFAEVIDVRYNLMFYEIDYKPLKETLDGFEDGKVRLYLTKYTVKEKLSWWKRIFGDYTLHSDIYVNENNS